MSDTVKGVEGERNGKDELGGSLGPGGERGDEVDQVRRVDGGVHGVEEVGDRTEVERAGEE